VTGSYGTATQLKNTAEKTARANWALTASELLQRCLDSGDREAWEEFVRRYRKTIALVVLRVSRAWNESSTLIIDDLVQETFLKLCEDNCRVLREFRSEQPQGLPGFLKVLAANLAQDYFRASNAMKRGVALTCSATEASPAGNNAAIEALNQAVLFNEIDEFLNVTRTREKHQAVFWLYYRDGLTAKAIASVSALGLSTKGVESIILRLTRQVRSRFHITPRETKRTG
jgi:RNA polymerase sigma-70 factor, ECF subfamily